MSIYSCFAFDKGSEFARLQTVKEQSAIVDTSPYMYPNPSASAFASVSELRRCKITTFCGKKSIILEKNGFLHVIIAIRLDNSSFKPNHLSTKNF